MLYIKRILTVHSLNIINLVKPLDYFFNSIKISQNIYMCVFVCKYTLGFIKYLLSIHPYNFMNWFLKIINCNKE